MDHPRLADTRAEGLTSTANDYNFASVNFTDASIVPYPGQPTGFN